MPGFPNKIIINSWKVNGMNMLIECDAEILKYLGEELQEMHRDGKLDLKETLDLRDKMIKLCVDYHKAQEKYHKGLEGLVEETRKKIEEALFPDIA